VKLLADLTPLRESPAFRRLWAGSTLSAVGGAMTSFALQLQVWDLTRSTAAVGLVALATLLPLLAVGLFGGALTGWTRLTAPTRPGRPRSGTDYRCHGPIIGETLNEDFSRPNWYMTSATR
jgi:Transmembrane secretion effector